MFEQGRNLFKNFSTKLLLLSLISKEKDKHISSKLLLAKFKRFSLGPLKAFVGVETMNWIAAQFHILIPKGRRRRRRRPETVP